MKKAMGTFIYRGSLAGAAGQLLFLLFAALSYLIPLGHLPYPHLFILAIPMYLLIGAVTGALIGIIVWGCYVKSGRNISPLVRALIGTGSILVIGLLWRLATNENDDGLPTPSLAYRITHTMVALATSGMLPGVAARPKNRGGQPRISNEEIPYETPRITKPCS